MEHFRSQCTTKDEKIKNYERKIERQNNQIEEMLLQKRTLVTSQKMLEEKLKNSAQQVSGNKKGNKGSNKIVDIFKQTKKRLNNVGEHFRDEDFPPERKSLIENWDDISELTLDIKDEWKQFEWVRADEIREFKRDPNDKLEVFKDGI